MIEEARSKGLKKSEPEPQKQKYKGRLVLRGDFVKDYSGSHAVFTEQGSSASHLECSFVHPIPVFVEHSLLLLLLLLSAA